jgi:uncharacterized membrane protein YphA (DoxX/SURF4 family)
MTLGTRVYGLAAAALGLPALILGTFAAMGLPVLPGTPGYPILLTIAGVWLVVAGLALQLRRTAVPASLALTLFFAAALLILHVPRAAADPTTWVSWEGVAELLAMTLGGALAFAATTDGPRAARIRRVAPLLFGACLMVFGISEFVYARFTAAMVPTWVPPSQLFWAYATGGAQIAAGLAMLSGVLDLLAARLLTAMYLGFGLLIHLPRVIADPASPGAWGEHGVNLVLAGAAWVLADTLAGARRRRRSAEAEDAAGVSP